MQAKYDGFKLHIEMKEATAKYQRQREIILYWDIITETEKKLENGTNIV